MLAFAFAHGFIFRLESSAGAAGIGAAHSGPGVARVSYYCQEPNCLWCLPAVCLLLPPAAVLLPGWNDGCYSINSISAAMLGVFLMKREHVRFFLANVEFHC